MTTKATILVVDDDLISLHVVQNYLAAAGFNCVVAEDGQQALQLLQAKPSEFAVVIADRIMPYLHGVDLLHAMREHPQLKTIPVIMLTGVAEKDEMLAAIKAGVFDFLYKPIEKELLFSVLNRALKTRF